MHLKIEKKMYTAKDFYPDKFTTSKIKWYKSAPPQIKEGIDLMRNTYNELKKLGILVFEYILHLSTNGYYIINEPWDIFYKKYPYYNGPFLIVVIKVNELDMVDFNDEKGELSISAQHSDIKFQPKKNFLKFMEEFNQKNNNITIKWDGSNKHVISFVFNKVKKN